MKDTHCTECHGLKWRYVRIDMGAVTSAQYRPCPDCGGSGKRSDQREREDGEGERWAERKRRTA